MNITAKFLIIILTATALAFSNVNAQESNGLDSEVPNRLSIGLMGGATIGHMNIGTDYDPTFGLNLRYAFNTKFALQTNFMFGKFTSNDADDNLLDRSFENSYAAASVTSQIGLLNLIGSESERFKWYGTVGLGLLFSDVTTSLGATAASPGTVDTFRGENHSETALFATFGTGVRVNVTHRIDVFAQYDYNITNSDIVDGFRTNSRTMIDQNRRNPDSWSALTAGIQFKFGSSSKDADWHRYTPGVDMQAFNLLEARVAGLESRVDHQDSRIDQNEDHIRVLQNSMDEFDEKLANLQALINERQSVELTMGSDILFAFDSPVVRESAKPSLAEIARALINNPDKILSVTGHTCDIGSTTYNQGLSERRAAAVKRYLVDLGINADRIITEGRGETQPLVPNNSEEARELNRRVEMVID